MPRPTASSAWQGLQAHRQKIAGVPLLELFAADPDRTQRFTLEAAGLRFDYSKQPINGETLQLLQTLASDAGLPAQIQALLAGEKVNYSEGRPAWHSALRAGDQAPAEVEAELQRIEAFSEALRNGEWLGYSGKPITDVINLGVGGSDLGPRLVCHALSGLKHTGPRVHFVANADGPELALTLQNLDPATTLFVVVSKSFGTAETRANAAAGLAWLQAATTVENAASRHFITVSAKPQAAREFGLPDENGFAIWDWVGGRYSLWSAVGISVALSLGMKVFRELLAGASAMDKHFSSAPLGENMPVVLGLLGIWQRNFFGIGQQVILPYSHYLEHLPAYLQQLEMESNGKRVDRDGKIVDYATGTSIWGRAGTNAQHAFLQWLQQGTAKLPVDFVLPISVPLQTLEQQRFQVASCLAQSAALMRGNSCDDMPKAEAVQRQLPGNRPSSNLVMPRLDARHLGALLALYEHKVFVQSVIWNINAFDQWGVEFGKRMASGLQDEFTSGQMTKHDPSTQALAEFFLAQTQASVDQDAADN